MISQNPAAQAAGFLFLREEIGNQELRKRVGSSQGFLIS
jgi:hypothetical protein